MCATARCGTGVSRSTALAARAFSCPRLFDRGADYYVFGGLAFARLTRNLVDEAKGGFPRSRHSRPRSRDPSARRSCSSPTSSRATSTQAITAKAGQVVQEVDGHKVKSLRDLVRRVEEPCSRYVSFGLSSGYRIAVNRAEARASGPEVLARYGVAADRSSEIAPRRAAIGRADERGQAQVAAGADRGGRR
jgi:hypothetical protein